jgi:endonuclease YncB( thermonuclease family)
MEFDQGQKPTIACVNLASVPLGVDFATLVAALQQFVDQHFAPVWGTPCTLVKAAKASPKLWNLLLLDDADQADALGYHDLTSGGLPVLKIFVKTTLAAGELVSVTASHELAEALVDPGCQMWASHNSRENWAYETADAVEETHFPVAGIEMSNFVHPAFFESFRSKGPFDHLGLLKKPFTLLSGGYTITQTAGRVGQKFGSAEKAARFAKEDRRQHRSEYRRAAADELSYPVIVLSVYDGDTLHVSVTYDAPPPFETELLIHRKLRLTGVNSPELKTPEGAVARDFTRRWLAEHTGPYTLTVRGSGQDKYSGRIDGRLIAADGHDLSDDLLAAGQAVVMNA